MKKDDFLWTELKKYFSNFRPSILGNHFMHWSNTVCVSDNMQDLWMLGRPWVVWLSPVMFGWHNRNEYIELISIGRV